MTANYADKISHLTREELALEMFKATEKADPESMEKAVAMAYSAAVAHESGLTVDPNEFCSMFFESLANEASSNGAARQCNFHLLAEYEPAITYLRGRYLDNDEWWEKYIANDAVLNEDFDEPIEVETAGAFVKDDAPEPAEETPAPKKKFFARVIAAAAALITKIISTFNGIVSKLVNGVKKTWRWVTDLFKKVFHFVGKVGTDLVDKLKKVQARMKSMPVLDIIYGVFAATAVAGVTTLGWNEIGKMLLAYVTGMVVSRPVLAFLRLAVAGLGVVTTAICASVATNILFVKLNVAISKITAKRIDRYNDILSNGGELDDKKKKRKGIWEKLFNKAQENLQEAMA